MEYKNTATFGSAQKKNKVDTEKIIEMAVCLAENGLCIAYFGLKLKNLGPEMLFKVFFLSASLSNTKRGNNAGRMPDSDSPKLGFRPAGQKFRLNKTCI